MNDIKRITLVGCFCRNKKVYHGQSTKARNYEHAVKERYNAEKVKIIDTDNWKRHPWIFLKLIVACLASDVVIILPAANGLKVILPICSIIKDIRKFKLLYAVVGGWLPELTKSNRNVAKHLFNVDRIYVETKAMLSRLQEMGYQNIEHAPVITYKEGVSEPTIQAAHAAPYRLCTFSRITKTKGITIAIEAVNSLNRKYKQPQFVLDLYGLVDPDYSQELDELVKTAEFGAVNLCGVLSDEELIRKLSEHDAMLFPTYYEGEGFPATVLESMLASTPVIASDWRYNSELVTPGYNGALFDVAKGSEDLARIVDEFFENPQQAVDMRKNCLEMAESCSPEKVLAPMFEYIS